MKSIWIILPWVLVPAVASEIRWTASGTVSGTPGAGFSGLAAAGDPVAIELVYETGAVVNARSFIPIGDTIIGRAWFHGPLKLAITVTIGDATWRGEMPEVSGETNVMESSCRDFGGSPDWFKVTLDSARGGTYPAFPQNGAETARSLEIEFRDDAAPADLFFVHQLPDTLSCLPQMTSAKGAVRAGAGAIHFELDPATVRVAQPQVPVTIANLPGGIELTWATEDGKNYRLESTSDLKCWVEEGRFSGDGNPVRDFFNPFPGDSRRFYRVVEN